MPLKDNHTIGNYTLLEKLGEGGMGAVYKACHRHFDDDHYAIKLIHSELASNAAVRDMFFREARILKRLSHPNIVSIHDFGEENGQLYLVMEYLHGRTLDHMLKEETGPLTSGRAVPLFRQLLQAVGHLHTQTPEAVIHRDIKPANIFILQDGTPKLIDFGIVRLQENPNDTTALHTSGIAMGTMAYMSPEQVHGHAAGRRSDIYSLGITLFQMLTGKAPYADSISVADLTVKILRDPVPRIRELYPQADERLQAVVDKATEKKKEDRFRNCAEFEAALYGESTTTELVESKPGQAILFFVADKSEITSGELLTISWAVDPMVVKGEWVVGPFGRTVKTDGVYQIRPKKTASYKLSAGGSEEIITVTVLPNEIDDELEQSKRTSSFWTKLSSSTQAYTVCAVLLIIIVLTVEMNSCLDLKGRISQISIPSTNLLPDLTKSPISEKNPEFVPDYFVNVIGGDGYITLRNRDLSRNEYELSQSGTDAAKELNFNSVVANLSNFTQVKVIAENANTYYVGVIINGAYTLGYIVKRFGRKPTLSKIATLAVSK